MGNRVMIANNNTGNNAVKKLLNTPGRSDCFSSGGLKVSRGLESIFFNVLENNGPAIIIVGIAIMIPYNMVSPRSALN